MFQFVFVIILSLIFAYYAEKKNSKIAFYLCSTTIALFSGLRGEYVGIDTPYTYSFFEALFLGNYVYTKDLGYANVSRFLMYVFEDPAALIFLYSSITNYLIIGRLWLMRRTQSFSFMLFIYLTMFYLRSMNIMRQFFAIAIVFWATKYLEEDKLLKYCILLLVATVFHTSAFIGVFLIFVHYWIDSKAKRSFKVIPIIIIAFLLAYSTELYVEFSNRYSHYFINIRSEFSPVLFYELACMCFIWLLAIYCLPSNSFSFTTNGQLTSLNKKTLFIAFCGVLLNLIFGYFFVFMGRIGLYFRIFEIPFWSQCIRITRYRLIVRSAIFVLVFYIFFTNFATNGFGIFPYYTIWSTR